MSFALSVDLRERVVAAIAAGSSCRQAAVRFGVSASSAIRWWQLERRIGSIVPKALGGDRRSGRIEAQAPLILGLVQATPDITLIELRAALAEQGHGFGLATLWRFFARRRITLKRMARPVCKGVVRQRDGLHQRIRSQSERPGQDGSRASRAS